MHLRLFALVSSIALAPCVANAGLDEGKAAFERADYPTALRELQPLAEQGNAYAQSRLGWMYLGGYGVARNPDEALKWLRKAVDQGDAHAQGGLGVMYVQGMGVGKDVAEGLRWIRMSADQGNPLAQNVLGAMYRHGEGVARNEQEALKWIAKAAGEFRKAADRGDASAQNMLASMHANGQGVAKDDAEAAKWLRKAAEQGHASAQFSLGVAYRTGRGVPRDVAEGLNWTRKAADQGDVQAQIRLGISYEQGEGVVRDEAEALKWYRKAADQGQAGARFRLIALEKKLAAANRDRPSSATPSPPQPDPALRTYNNAVHRWSVSYPSDWKLDAANPADVRVVSPAGDGLCGLHSVEVRFTTVDEYADSMQAQTAKYFKDRGVAVREAPKKRIALENGANGIDVTTEILSGGRSRRVYFLADAKGYTIDCETHATNWGKLEPFFSRIIGSFSPGGKP